jgi:hypothetical protein
MMRRRMTIITFLSIVVDLQDLVRNLISTKVKKLNLDAE